MNQRTTLLHSSVLILAFALATGSLAAPVPGVTATLPVEPTGLLGDLDLAGGTHVVTFDTSTGLYAVDGVLRNDETLRRLVVLDDASGKPAPPWYAFDFESIDLGEGTIVKATGTMPLLLLSQGDATVAGTLDLDGAPGSTAGVGAGGGGGGGGGALALIAQGELVVTGLISANGGPGGQGDLRPGQPIDPTHSRGGDGGGGSILLASEAGIVFGGAASTLTGGSPDQPAGPVTLVGPVTIGSQALINGKPAYRASTLNLISSVRAEDFYVTGGGGGAGAGGSGLFIDENGREVRDGYATAGGLGGLAGAGGGSGGAGMYAVAGGAGGDGGNGGNGGGGPSGGGSGGGGGGGGAYSGPGGAGGLPGLGARAGLPGGGGADGAGGVCASSAGGGGGAGGRAAWPDASTPGGPGGGGGGGGNPTGSDGGAGGDGVGPHGGFPSADGGGGGGGGGAHGGDGGDGGKGGDGSDNFTDGGGGGGGGGGGADSCVSGTPPGDGGSGGPGGRGTNSGGAGGSGEGVETNHAGDNGGNGTNGTGGTAITPQVSNGPYQYHREVTGPTTVKSSIAGEFGIAACDDNGTIAQQASFVDCGSGGIGAIIVVTDISSGTNYVSGTCRVNQTSAPDSAFIGEFSYSCGTDRDNDGIVTNFDASTTTLGDKNTGSPDTGNTSWDDDFNGTDVSSGGQGSANICFRADVDSGGSSGGYPTLAIWDDIVVFIAVNADQTAHAAGTFAVSVDVVNTSNGGCTPSSHDTNGWVM
jgi:hypothetical protein